MFCEKCGHQVNPGEKFCENCGAPLTPIPVQPEYTQPAQPEYTQPVQPEYAQPVQPEYTQPEYTQPAQPDFAQNAAPAAPMQDAVQPQYTAPAPKKPMSKGLKMGLIFGGAGAVVLIALLITVFAVIVPNANKVDVKKYFSVNINNIDDTITEANNGSEKELSVSDGAIGGYFEFDYGQFAKDKGIDLNDAESDKSALYAVSSYIDVDVSLKSGTGEADYFSFSGASKDNVYTVKLTWPEENSLYATALNHTENEMGVKFNHAPVTFEFKLADYLNKKGIKVKEAVEADILSYIKGKNLIYTEGEDGRASAYVKGFETTIGGYTFKKGDYSFSVDVYDENNNQITYFYLQLDKSDNLRNGDKIKLSYDNDYLDYAAEKGIRLTGDAVEYTVKAEPAATVATTAPAVTPKSTEATKATEPATVDASKEKGLSAEEAVKAKASLKDFFAGKVADFIKNDSDAKEGDKLELRAVYYSHDKDSDFRRMMFIYENTTKKYFKSMAANPEDFLVKDGKVQLEGDYMYFSDEGKGKTLDEAVEATWYLGKSYGEYYNNTEIKY